MIPLSETTENSILTLPRSSTSPGPLNRSPSVILDNLDKTSILIRVIHKNWVYACVYTPWLVLKQLLIKIKGIHVSRLVLMACLVLALYSVCTSQGSTYTSHVLRVYPACFYKTHSVSTKLRMFQSGSKWVKVTFYVISLYFFQQKFKQHSHYCVWWIFYPIMGLKNCLSSTNVCW